jgi:hypothetical protein
MSGATLTHLKDLASSPTSQHDDAHGKALSLNLEGAIYGTLAEIGAGQEVARWFLSVGGASGTVAKTISAYDKRVSDEIYGAGTRYVSKERLLAMLDHEYELLLERLEALRGEDKRFFVFADTVAARNYEGTNQQHGWLGVRFQADPGSEPSQILLHINLCDSTAQQQQQAVGILGVNLVYATFHQRLEVNSFLDGLFDDLSVERIEIDVIEFDGPAFPKQDRTEWRLALLCRKMARAIIFGAGGEPVEPASVLRKRPMIVMRGTFSHPELINPSLIEAAMRQLRAESGRCEREPVTLLEMTIHHISRAGALSTSEMSELVRRLTPRGPVIASDLPETYLLSRYLRRYSTEPIRFVMSVAAAAKVMHETFYQDLPGALLEGLGRLFATNVKLYVAPMPRGDFIAASRDVPGAIAVRPSAAGLVELDDLMPSTPGCYLLQYLRAAGQIVALAPFTYQKC